MNLVFGNQGRKSPYDPLLDQLAAAQPGMALKFGDVRVRSSLYARAKKKGLRISFAESGGALYLRFDDRMDDDVKAGRRKEILMALMVGPATSAKIAVVMRDKGDRNVDGALVEVSCAQMQRAGELVKMECGAWALNLAKKAA